MNIKEPKYKFNNVLLIDDSTLDNFINSKLLEAAHFSKHIHVSCTGEGGLAFVNKLIHSESEENNACLDIIFLDLNMPVMDGFDFIANFKKMNKERLKTCRIVVLTSSINHQDRERVTSLDPDIAFVNKPLTAEFLKSLDSRDPLLDGNYKAAS